MAEQTGAMIALMIPPAVAEQVKLSMEGALPSAELHVTLAYLGEVQDLPADGRAKALEVVKAVAALFEPVKGQINGSGRFVNTDTGQDAIYLNFDSPELPGIRMKIIDALKQAGMPAEENHGFSPHITLAYVDPAVELPKFELPGEPVTVEGLTLAWGGEMEEVKFGAPEPEPETNEDSAAEADTPVGAQPDAASEPEPTANKAAVKAAGDWELDVLGVPFGGPDGGKDSDGQWFTARTNIHRESYPAIPVVYYHGLSPDRRPMGEPEIIGKAQYLRVGPEGHWWHVVLDKGSALAKRIWEAAKAGKARASSGTIDYLARMLVRGVKRMYDKLVPGEITNWPVAELTLIDAEGNRQPANNYAVALPSAKTVFDRAGLNLPDIQPEPEPKGQGEESRSEGKDKGNNFQGANKMGALDAETQAMIAKIVSDTLAADRTAQAAKAKADADLQKQIDDKVAAAKVEWEAAAAKSRRLPMGGPHVNKWAETSKYDNLSAVEMGLMIDMQANLHAARPQQMADVSNAAMKALMLKVARLGENKESPDTQVYAKSALKAYLQSDLSDEAIKAATDPNYVSTGIGSEWVGTAYSNQLWENIRAATRVVAKIPSDVIPDGFSSDTVPLEYTDPTWYKVAEVSANNATTGIPDATVTASQVGTANKNVTVAKMGARDVYSGELTEDSLIAYVPQLRKQLEISGAEMMEHVVIDGDTATSSNINDIGGTTYSGAATSLFLLTNGFRKSCLVTTTANSRSAAGLLSEDDFLETMWLMGTAGLAGADIAKCGFVIDPNVYKAALKMATVKTKDVWTQATMESGVLTKIWGYEIIPSWFQHYRSAARKANSAGKVDLDTTTNNLYGAILSVRWDQWRLKYKRRMTMETTRIASADAWEVVALARWGLGQRDTEASAITYYVGV